MKVVLAMSNGSTVVLTGPDTDLGRIQAAGLINPSITEYAALALPEGWEVEVHMPPSMTCSWEGHETISNDAVKQIMEAMRHAKL